jgi:hypothetical protein
VTGARNNDVGSIWLTMNTIFQNLPRRNIQMVVHLMDGLVHCINSLLRVAPIKIKLKLSWQLISLKMVQMFLN